MTSQQSFKHYFYSVIALTAIGWSGLFFTLIYSLPFVWSRWSFFVFGIMALTGSSLPIIYFLHRRFPSEPPAQPNVIVRQALWVGTYGAILAWLQLGRLITIYVILGLAGGFIAAEYFIRIREQAIRQPNPGTQDDKPAA